MSAYGYLFVVCAFLECILHAGLSPADFVRDVSDAFHARTKPARERIGEDVSAAGELGKRFL
ncbi:hypothetical protein E3U26_18740 (plasmid) [Paracoccus ferrooxidans]|nr:hypothetical protein E3U26_18740 [Paracoccus ferrooxidans]